MVVCAALAEDALSETVYSCCLALPHETLMIQTDYINFDKNHLKREVPNATFCQRTKCPMFQGKLLYRYLFEGLQNLGSLAEVFEDELQRPRH